MTPEILNADQKDALQEISNIAMGTAACGLAKVLESFVLLSVPRITIVETSRIAERLAAGLRPTAKFRPFARRSTARWEGEVVVVFGEDGAPSRRSSGPRKQRRNDRVVVARVRRRVVLAGRRRIAHQLATELSFSPPEILCRAVPLERVFAGHQPTCDQALLIEIDFSLEARSFACHMLTFLAPESFDALRSSLSRFLESI